MVSKNEIKLIASLSQKKYRHQTGLFVVEGEKMVAEALASSFEVERVYITSGAQQQLSLLAANARNDRAQTFTVEEVSEAQMKSMSALSSPSPALALVHIPQYDADDLFDAALNQGSLSLALDGVRDPGNLGTIMRIADWFGVDCIFASEDTVDIFNPKTVQATMGAIFRKTLIYTDISQIASRMIQAGRNVYGTFLDGNDIYREQISADGLVVMGNESNGISNAVRSHVTHRLYIPSFCNVPTSESLNVAIATAVTLSEFRRRENTI